MRLRQLYILAPLTFSAFLVTAAHTQEVDSSPTAIGTEDEECFDVKWLREDILQAQWRAGLLKDKPMANPSEYQRKVYEEKIKSLEARIPAAKEACKASAAKGAAERAEKARVAKLPGVRIGMAKKQVITKTSWGEPDSVNKTTNASGTVEQWVYGGGQYLYFTNGRLTTIQN